MMYLACAFSLFAKLLGMEIRVSLARLDKGHSSA